MRGPMAVHEVQVLEWMKTGDNYKVFTTEVRNRPYIANLHKHLVSLGVKVEVSQVENFIRNKIQRLRALESKYFATTDAEALHEGSTKETLNSGMKYSDVYNELYQKNCGHLEEFFGAKVLGLGSRFGNGKVLDLSKVSLEQIKMEYQKSATVEEATADLASDNCDRLEANDEGKTSNAESSVTRTRTTKLQTSSMGSSRRTERPTYVWSPQGKDTTGDMARIGNSTCGADEGGYKRRRTSQGAERQRISQGAKRKRTNQEIPGHNTINRMELVGNHTKVSFFKKVRSIKGYMAPAEEMLMLKLLDKVEATRCLSYTILADCVSIELFKMLISGEDLSGVDKQELMDICLNMSDENDQLAEVFSDQIRATSS